MKSMITFEQGTLT